VSEATAGYRMIRSGDPAHRLGRMPASFGGESAPPGRPGGLLLPSRRRSAGRVPIRSYAILYTVRPPLTT